MDDRPRYTRTTIIFGIAAPTWREIGAILLVALVALAMLWALIDVVMPGFGFDGKFGPGCDKGNPNCHVHRSR